MLYVGIAILILCVAAFWNAQDIKKLEARLVFLEKITGHQLFVTEDPLVGHRPKPPPGPPKVR